MSFGADIVFAAKARGSGDPEEPNSPTRFKFLSSGAFMARIHRLTEILEGDIDQVSTDEDFYQRVFREGRQHIKLDTKKVIFCNLADHEDDTEQLLEAERRFIVKETSSVPFLLYGSKIEGQHVFYRMARRMVQSRTRISAISISPTRLQVGETLWFQLNVANFNEFDLKPQLPDPAHVYNASSNFVLDGFGSEFAAFRIGIDFQDRQ